MKKLIAITALIIMVITMFAGCKKTECDICGDDTFCRTEEIFGEKGYICNDCYKGLKEFGNAMRNGF